MNPEPPAPPPADKPATPEAKPAAPPAAAPKPAVPPKPPAAPPKPAVMVTTPWEDELTGRLAKEFGSRITEFVAYVGQKFLVAEASCVPALIEYLRDAEGYDYLVDITAVDWPKRDDRFDLVYILYSFASNERIRVKTRIKEGQNPQTVVPVHPTANWLEREVYDMYGIVFDGHPDLRRILMPDDWRGFPLRKDYNVLKMDERWVEENLGIESAQ